MQTTILRLNLALATSLLCLAAGLLLLLTHAGLIDSLVKSNLVLAPDNHLFSVWHKNPIPLTIDFYFHNWTNPQEVYDRTKKPRFQQVGPYRFGETKEKVNITFNGNNNTVTFRHLKYWYFDAENSNGSLSDVVHTINPVLLTAATQMRDYNAFLKLAFASFSSYQTENEIHVTKTIGELLFDGYEDPFITMGNVMPLINTVPGYDKFGWFYKRNGSTTFEGIFNMATGVGNNVGELLEWNYESRTSFFEGHCTSVSSSAGELFTPPSRTSIKFFSPDICRYLELDYKEDVLVKDLQGYKFASGPSMLDNGTQVPRNKCFCVGECIPSGVFNISACRYGSPAFVSLPHFYGADPSYVEALEGVKPEKEKHDFFIILQPTTGVALKVAARLQLNLLMRPLESMSAFKNVPRVFFPVLWFEQQVTIPDDMALQMRMLLSLPLICTVLASVIIAASAVAAVFFFCKLRLARRNCMKNLNGDGMAKEEVPLNRQKKT